MTETIWLLIMLLNWSSLSHIELKIEKSVKIKKVKKSKKYIRCEVDENCPGEDSFCDGNICRIDVG